MISHRNIPQINTCEVRDNFGTSKMVSPKKNAGRFKKGSQPYYKKGEKIERWTHCDLDQVPTVRLTSELYDQVVKAPMSSPVNETSCHRLLRPPPAPKNEPLR